MKKQTAPTTVEIAKTKNNDVKVVKVVQQKPQMPRINFSVMYSGKATF